MFESLQIQSDEERDLHTTLSRPHMQKLMSVHDIVRSRSYETPVPQFDPTWHPQTNYDRHVKRGKGGKGKAPEYRTVGLHKSANEPLVSCRSVGLSVGQSAGRSVSGRSTTAHFGKSAPGDIVPLSLHLSP